MNYWQESLSTSLRSLLAKATQRWIGWVRSFSEEDLTSWLIRRHFEISGRFEISLEVNTTFRNISLNSKRKGIKCHPSFSQTSVLSWHSFSKRSLFATKTGFGVIRDVIWHSSVKIDSKSLLTSKPICDSSRHKEVIWMAYRKFNELTISILSALLKNFIIWWGARSPR